MIPIVILRTMLAAPDASVTALSLPLCGVPKNIMPTVDSTSDMYRSFLTASIKAYSREHRSSISGT